MSWDITRGMKEGRVFPVFWNTSDRGQIVYQKSSLASNLNGSPCSAWAHFWGIIVTPSGLVFDTEGQVPEGHLLF